MLVPMLLLLFATTITVLFYYHDKNLILGALYETAVLGTEQNGYEENELIEHCISLTKGKMLWFGNVSVTAEIDKEKITLQGLAKKRGLVVKKKVTFAKTRPERYIRDIRKLNQWIE